MEPAMDKKRATSMVIFACVFVITATAMAAAQSKPEIKGMKAYLFYNPSGSLSENIIDNSDFTLYNTIIGGGSAKEPSNQTLVVVGISGKCPAGMCKAYFSAIEKYGRKKVLLKRAAEVFCETDECNAAFMLYDTGCTPVELSARMHGGKKTLKKKIKFYCAE